MTTTGYEVFGAASTRATRAIAGDPPRRQRSLERAARRKNGLRSELGRRHQETMSAIIWCLGKRTVTGHLSDVLHDEDEVVARSLVRVEARFSSAFCVSPRVLVL